MMIPVPGQRVQFYMFMYQRTGVDALFICFSGTTLILIKPFPW